MKQKLRFPQPAKSLCQSQSIFLLLIIIVLFRTIHTPALKIHDKLTLVLNKGYVPSIC